MKSNNQTYYDYAPISSSIQKVQKSKIKNGRRRASTIDQSNTLQRRKNNHQHLRSKETRVPAFRADTIHNVTGQIKAISFIGSKKEDLSKNIAILKAMTSLLIKHPDYTKKSWHKTDSFNDVVLHITNSFDQLFAKEHPVYISNLKGKKPTFHWIDVCIESYSNDSKVLEFDFIQHLRKKNRKLFNLTKQFLYIWSPLRIDWISHDDYLCDLEWQMNECPEELEGWIDDLDELKKSFSKWKRIFKFIKKCTFTRCSIEDFKNNLDNYNPRIPAYIKLKKWYQGVIELIQDNISLEEFQNSPLTEQDDCDRDYFTNGEAWPGQYVSFTWDLGDSIGHQICSYLDDVCNQVGLVPLIEHQQIKPDCLIPPTFYKAKKLCDWLKSGQDAIRNLYQYNS